MRKNVQQQLTHILLHTDLAFAGVIKEVTVGEVGVGEFGCQVVLHGVYTLYKKDNIVIL